MAKRSEAEKADRPKYTIVRDTREKEGHGWHFRPSVNCAGTVQKKLDTGDYAIEGLEQIVCVDRKGCVDELAANLMDPRFERELERMRGFEIALIVCEFDYEDLVGWPFTGNIPKSKARYIKMRGPVLVKRMWELTLKHGARFEFLGIHAREAVASLFKRVWDAHGPARSAG